MLPPLSWIVIELCSSRIAEKEKESKAIASSLKKHQETSESQATMQSTMQMMGLQMLQKMMKENDIEEDTHKSEKEMTILKTELVEVKHDIKAFADTLQGIQETQSQLLGLLAFLRHGPNQI
jgi:peptidoglycan hydrolase CwlO-like protein